MHQCDNNLHRACPFQSEVRAVGPVAMVNDLTVCRRTSGKRRVLGDHFGAKVVASVLFGFIPSIPRNNSQLEFVADAIRFLRINNLVFRQGAVSNMQVIRPIDWLNIGIREMRVFPGDSPWDREGALKR